jgi:hypothetical protein
MSDLANTSLYHMCRASASLSLIGEPVRRLRVKLLGGFLAPKGSSRFEGGREGPRLELLRVERWISCCMCRADLWWISGNGAECDDRNEMGRGLEIRG